MAALFSNESHYTISNFRMQSNPCALQAEGQGGRGEPQRQALWLHVEAGNESNGSPRGIMPHRWLKLKFNSLRPFSWTIFSGMVPFSCLFDRSDGNFC